MRDLHASHGNHSQTCSMIQGDRSVPTPFCFTTYWVEHQDFALVVVHQEVALRGLSTNILLSTVYKLIFNFR